MSRAAALSLLLFSSALTLAAAATGTTGETPAERGRLVLWNPEPGTCDRQRLVRVDPKSLKLLPGRTLAVPNVSAGPTLSPSRSLAVLDGAYGGRLEFVDPIRMRRAGSIRIGGTPDYAQALAWPRRRTLVALDVDSSAHDVALTKVDVVDPIARRRVAEARFSSWAKVGYATTGSGRTAVLLVSWRHLVPPRLVVVDPTGSVRQMRIPGFRAGVSFDRIGEVRRFPALAVDPQHERAYVALEHEPVAVIDLRSLRIRYRRFRLPAPGRSDFGPIHGTGTDNPTHGPQREAAWLGHGKFALMGFDSMTKDGGERDAGAGLSVVDTRTKTLKTAVHGRFSLVPDTTAVVATGYSQRGSGRVIVFGRAGTRVRVIRTPNGSSFPAGQVAIPRGRGKSWAILDPVTGKTVGHAPLRRVQAVQQGYC